MALRVKRPVCVGLDVHKNNVWVSVIIHRRDRDIPVYKTMKFKSNHTALSEMCDWIRMVFDDPDEVLKYEGNPKVDDIHVYMESTGKYSTPVYNTVKENGLHPHMVNPKNVRTISGQKTDQKDCEWIAELGSGGYLRESYIPEKAIKEARSVSRRRTKIRNQRADEIRRIQNVLVESNFRFDLIFSDISGKSSMEIIKYLIQCEKPELEEIKKHISRTCKILRFKDDDDRKQKEEELLNVFQGAQLSEANKFILRSAVRKVEALDKELTEHENMMREILKDFNTELELIRTIPGISELSSMQILAETGADTSVFKDVKAFISWCGLCPASRESNNRHKSVKIGKGGHYLKPVLIQCALNATRHDPYFKKKYDKIRARRGNKRALVAIARKMMVSMFYMLTTGEVFNPTDHDRVVNEIPPKSQSTWEAKAARENLESAALCSSRVSDADIELALKVLKKAGINTSEIQRRSNTSESTQI